MGDLASVRIIVYGRVHGVFFRSFTTSRARELGLTGYVRNVPNGTVEVYAEGERKQLEKLVEAVKIGPPAARVDKIVTEWAEYSGKYRNFVISPH